MGWTCTVKPTNVAAYLQRQFNHESEHYKYECLRGAFVGLSYYTATRRTDKKTGAIVVFACVTLVRYSRSEYYGFCTKDITEDMGPVEARCPKTILGLLTEPENESAAAWRAKCHAYHAARSAPVDPEKLKQWARDNGAWNFDDYSDAMRKRWRAAYRRHHPTV